MGEVCAQGGLCAISYALGCFLEKYGEWQKGKHEKNVNCTQDYGTKSQTEDYGSDFENAWAKKNKKLHI